MAESSDFPSDAIVARVWSVGALCRAVADALEARFNPVRVTGELSGFTRASSGHCYFVLKDAAGQLRCAMFRRAASQLDFVPRDGELVELRGRIGVYEPRGELQLVAESMVRAGQGALFERFFQIKEKLQAEGLFDAGRKRPLPAMPRVVGVVTSLGAAAWHDVVTALQRRAPHVEVVLAPALVQGEQAPSALVRALEQLYRVATASDATYVPIDAILLVRGGGSLEDLWAFNDEHLARTIARSPVPLISGVGHETDFTVADFVADVRAPTPTAAAELVSPTTLSCLQVLSDYQVRLQAALERSVEREAQRLDRLGMRVGRPSGRVQHARMRLEQTAQALSHARAAGLRVQRARWEQGLDAVSRSAAQLLAGSQSRLAMLELRLRSTDPRLVLQRGYAWLTQVDGQPVSRAAQLQVGQEVLATLADGAVAMAVRKAPVVKTSTD